uniref:MHC class I antigen n=1 Tax=Ctenopharyngodon idella TaxID=7959 RepID=A0A141BTM4_CTEID|nr:MHC class I antigen [Ctenopharyngodon idella]
MRSVVLLLLGAQLAYAGTHSLKYVYTGVSRGIDFPEFTAVGMVDDGQFMYFDSNSMKAVPKTEWIRQNEGADYWDSQTQGLIGSHQTFKNNIQIAMEWFNQSKGVHVVQQMYGCSWDEETGDVDGFDEFGYDGEDFITLDLKNLRYITTKQEALITQVNWNNNKALLEGKKQYRAQICIEWLKKYLKYGEKTLKREVSPQVSLLQKTSSSPVTCHATGFYPSGVTITWIKNGQEHHEDVELGELVPNEDGTFQKSSTLRVTPEEWKKNKYSCVVEHQGETKEEKEIRTNGEDSISIGIIVGALAAVVLLIVIGAAGYVVYKKKQGFKPVSGSDDGSNSSART